ncbi:MAG: amino acid adenylation domain-containing protein, partial [Firmicutes bacterium]|nr:amino acid adenylation domain-containing protein [Bacillota bacterium]
ITTEAFGAVFEQASIPVVLADKLDWSWDGAELPCRARGEDLAYVVYTSGSTGTPKGVMIEQGALVNFARAMDGIFANGGVLSVCNTGFDVFVLETVAALLCGRTVILVPDEYSNDPAVLADLIKRYAANCFAVTPSRLEAYLGNPDFMQAVGSVESIICGGEPLTGDFINRLERLTKARIYNQYGASETTIGVSCKCLNQSPSITAGKPMANCRLYVLDDNRNPLPVGAVGTLYVGGVCVGRGYINNDEATEKNFVADPFEIDGRMYNTGDLARWEKSGEITILGRRDAQVKLNGHRIEPQEISSVLLTHPAVGQAAVQITKQENSGCITAYYTSPAELGEDELYEACASLLPEYMIPRFFIRVDVIPLTPNGKTDFAALPAPAPIVQTGSADKKTSKSEQAVLDVFKRVLKQDGLTADSGYFQSGGDSLNALTALLEIARLPGGEAINPTDLRRLATPAKIAEKMDKSRTDPQAAPAKNKLAPVSRASYPLTAIQKSILFSSFSDPTGIAYNMPGGFELPWTPDKQALENAVTGLIASEDVFRTAFTFEGAEAVAKILPSAPFRLETVAGNAYEDACRAFVRPFDLAHPPLIRAGLWERNGRAVLLVDVHHMINDGEGTALLLGRLDRLYRGEKPQNAGLSYKDYACYLDEKTDKTVIDAAYWKQKLSPAPGRLNLSQKPENGVSDAAQAGGALSVKMDRALSDGINKYCRENNMTAYTFLAAALGVLLSGLSGQTDFVIGTPVAGRDLPETRGMLGAFIHTLPLRMNVDRGQTAADYLRTVAADAADMLGHNSVTQEQLLSLAGGGNGYSGLYNVMFSMHPDYRQSFTLGGRKLTYLPVKTGTVKMDLVLEAFKAGPEYTISLEYAAALFGENAVALYARSLTVIAEGMIQHPARRIGDLRLLSDADHKAALKAAAGEAVPYIHAMLDVMADTFAYNNPNADAVVFGDGRMSYDAFRKRSDGIAAQLMHCGVKRGDAVGVYCGRTPDLLCGVFGILKCGAAYLPLSDALPKERIQQMLDSAGARAVLCDGGHAADASIDEKYIKCVISDESPEFTPVSGRNAGDLAQVLFTSGSTGQPKGVTISHRSLSGLLVNLKQIYGGGGALGGVLCSSSVLFDSFTMEAVIPLALGLSVVLADQTEIMNPRMLAARLKKSGVQAMFSTPSRIRVLLGDDLFSKAVSKLKVLLVGGEPMPEPLAKKLKAVCPGDVYNLYGPAEATVFVTSWKVNEAEPVAIGRPVANARVYVLDEKMRPVLPGAVGEIHIGGDCLSNGYIGRDDLTRAAFIDNPFAPGEKLYCTGDLARVLDDGRVDYLGRKDGQIKLNGQRIELEEISGAIVNTGMALDAAVVAVKKGKDQHAGVSLRAFVVPVRNRPFDEAILRGELGKALPQYMVPGEIVVIETIPLTATGKTDTRALTEYESGTQNDAPDEAADGADGAGIAGSAPGTDGESRVQAVDAGDINAVRTALLSLWKEVLGADRIDCGRSFFEQGGTSLACMNLLIRYFKYGWEIKLNIFYEKPTLNEQADLIMSIYGQSNAAQEQTSAEAVPAVVQTLSAAGQDCAPILITGATGFFGAHIVYELANQCRGDIYCLVRGAPKRLYEVLETYFTEQWVGDNQARIVPIIGDIAEPDLGVAAQKYNQLTKKIKTVYHCAADVRHYMSENEAERANVGGTRNVVAFCERAGAYLVFVSTLSVGGEKIERAYEGRYPGLTEVEFDESSFDIGQNWRDNVYVRSKFLAEQEVQKAAGRGLEAVILRVGRLVGRASDGRFQINKEANYFYNVITGIARLGMVPEGVCDTALELTPVDACAKAAVLLTSGRITGAAHLASPYTATIAAAVGALVNGGIAEKDLRYRKLTRIGLDAYKKMVLSGASGASPSAVLQDASMLNSSLALNTNGFIRTKITSGATDERLRRMGFAWPAVDIALLLREFMQMQNQETPEAGA